MRGGLLDLVEALLRVRVAPLHEVADLVHVGLLPVHERRQVPEDLVDLVHVGVDIPELVLALPDQSFVDVLLLHGDLELDALRAH